SLAQPVDHTLDRRHVDCGQTTEMILRAASDLVETGKGRKLGRRNRPRHRFSENRRMPLLGTPQNMPDLRVENLGGRIVFHLSILLFPSSVALASVRRTEPAIQSTYEPRLEIHDPTTRQRLRIIQISSSKRSSLTNRDSCPTKR